MKAADAPRVILSINHAAGVKNMRSINNAFYRSKIWRQCRAGYIKSVGGLCEQCQKEGKITAGVIVHHKFHLTEENYKDPSIALNYGNLELLCAFHHNRLHFGAEIIKRYEIDDNGNVIILDDNV